MVAVVATVAVHSVHCKLLCDGDLRARAVGRPLYIAIPRRACRPVDRALEGTEAKLDGIGGSASGRQAELDGIKALRRIGTILLQKRRMPLVTVKLLDPHLDGRLFGRRYATRASHAAGARPQHVRVPKLPSTVFCFGGRTAASRCGVHQGSSLPATNHPQLLN